MFYGFRSVGDDDRVTLLSIPGGPKKLRQLSFCLSHLNAQTMAINYGVNWRKLAAKSNLILSKRVTRWSSAQAYRVFL